MGGSEDEILVAGIRNKLPHYAEGPIVKGFGRGSTELGRLFESYISQHLQSYGCKNIIFAGLQFFLNKSHYLSE